MMQVGTRATFPVVVFAASAGGDVRVPRRHPVALGFRQGPPLPTRSGPSIRVGGRELRRSTHRRGAHRYEHGAAGIEALPPDGRRGDRPGTGVVQASSMPGAAIGMGSFDYVLLLDAIGPCPGRLVELARECE